MISPAFAENNVPVVFATDKNYALYLSVAIKSLIDNSSADNNYDILILDTGMGDKTKAILFSLADKNISIRIIDTAYILSKYGDLFYTPHHLVATTYLRIFIPELLKQYKKVVYLDCDLIVLDDIAKLFNTNIEQFCIVAIPDYALECKRIYDKDIKDYIDNILEINGKYINAGVLIFNINSWIEKGLISHCIEFMKTGIKFLCADQCVINATCNGDICYLDERWNVMWGYLFSNLPEEDKENYRKYALEPKILHFTSDQKPWNNPKIELADIWWNYAKKLDWYADILEISLDDISTNIKRMEKRTERHLSIIAEKNKLIAELEEEIVRIKGNQPC